MKIKYSTQEQIGDAVMAIMGFFGILAGACCIGMLLAITKAILILFGIENNL